MYLVALIYEIIKENFRHRDTTATFCGLTIDINETLRKVNSVIREIGALLGSQRPKILPALLSFGFTVFMYQVQARCTDTA